VNRQIEGEKNATHIRTQNVKWHDPKFRCLRTKQLHRYSGFNVDGG